MNPKNIFKHRINPNICKNKAMQITRFNRLHCSFYVSPHHTTQCLSIISSPTHESLCTHCQCSVCVREREGECGSELCASEECQKTKLSKTLRGDERQGASGSASPAVVVLSSGFGRSTVAISAIFSLTGMRGGLEALCWRG